MHMPVHRCDPFITTDWPCRLPLTDRSLFISPSIFIFGIFIFIFIFRPETLELTLLIPPPPPSSWTVTFQSVPGDLPLLVAYPGRLTPLSHGVAMTVTEKVAGSPAVLVYDGSSAPEVRSYTVSNLNSDMTFAFKVLPYNFLGKGVLSAPTVTTIPRSGASPIYTTAR